VTRAVTRSWYRIALARPGGPPSVVAAAGEHLGAAVAAAERHAPGAFAIAADLAPDSDIPLGESLGKSPVVELAAVDGLADAPVFRWPIGVLPQLSRATAARGVRRGFIERPHPASLVLEAQTDADHLIDLFMGLIERLPSADNLEIRLLDHFDDAGQTDVWLTSRVDARRILRFLDDHDAELFGHGHLELSVYVRAHHGTLRLTEHKTVVWLADERALEADVVRWLGELAVPRVAAGAPLVTVKDAPHFHFRPAASRDRKQLADELYRQRLRRVGRGECLEHREPRRLPAPSAWRKRIDDAAARQGVPGRVVAQHRPVAAERTQRVLHVELHETALARSNFPRPEHRGATDGVCRAEVQVNRQPVAQRSFGVPRDAQ